MSTPAAHRGPLVLSLLLGATLVSLTPHPAAAQAASAPASSSGSESQIADQTTSTSFLSEPRILGKAIDRAVDILGDGSSSPTTSGFFLETSNMVTGSGWLAVGPGYRHPLFDGHALLEGSAALSWRAYKMVQGRFEFPNLADDHLTVGSQVMWRDMMQVQYWGLGDDTSEDWRSQYRMKTANAVGYARVRPNAWLTIGGDLGYLRRPTLEESSGWFERDLPSTFVLFPLDPGVSPGTQPNFLHGGLSVVADTRDHRGHPTSGGVYRAAWSTFRDQDLNTFTFHRYEAEAAQFVPLGDRRWVFAFHGWGVVSDVAENRDVPLYLMPSLGGSTTIRTYSDFRFHDRNMVVVTAESRWAVFPHVDAAAFFDAGNVAHRARDLNFDKTAYGVGFRLHTERTTIARVELARGNGGWNVLFRLGDPLHLKRLSRRMAPVPFAP